MRNRFGAVVFHAGDRRRRNETFIQCLIYISSSPSLFTIPSSIEPAVAGDICKDQSHRRSAQKRISLLFVDGFSSPVADKNLIGQLPDSLMSRGLPRKHWLWILPSRRGGESIVSAILLPAPVSLSSSAAAATIGFSIQFNSPAAVALP